MRISTGPFAGQGAGTRGQGTAEATVTLQLSETDGAAEGTVSADLALSGKAAAMGKSIIGTVADQMMALFAANLEAMMAEPAAADPLSGEAATAAEPLGLLAAVAFIAFKPGRSDNNRPRGRSARPRSSPLTLDCAPVYPVLTVAAPECP